MTRPSPSRGYAAAPPASGYVLVLVLPESTRRLTLRPFARVLLRAVMPAIVRDHRTQARLIEESGLAWTIIRGPLIFTDGPHTRRYHAGPIGRDSRPAISRADLADFMLKTSTAGAFIRMKLLVSA